MSLKTASLKIFSDLKFSEEFFLDLGSNCPRIFSDGSLKACRQASRLPSEKIKGPTHV
jgi:hypothetical protein